MAKYLTSVYVSGWQCSSTASTSNEPGPDVADYPYDTVPNKVRSSVITNRAFRWTSSSEPSSSTTASSTRSAAA